MRNAFAREMSRLAAIDPRVVLLSGDVGNRLFNSFKDEFPERFFNCGVAEANMTGMAAGLALCGLRPVTYSITPFSTTRCLEQIKIDVCYQHHSFEDIALLRSLPNMTVVCPGDSVEVRLALRSALRHGGPVYIRLGKKNEPVIHGSEPPFEIGKGIVIRGGREVCLLSTGNMLPVAMEAAALLEEKGIRTGVVSLHTVKPIDSALLDQVFTTHELVATMEEHSVIGGLAGAVAEWLADRPRVGAKFLRFGIADAFLHGTGDQENARRISGLTPAAVAGRVHGVLRGDEG